jgi:hypothetical protein
MLYLTIQSLKADLNLLSRAFHRSHRDWRIRMTKPTDKPDRGPPSSLPRIKTFTVPTKVSELIRDSIQSPDRIESLVFEPGSRLRVLDLLAYGHFSSLKSICVPSSVEIFATHGFGRFACEPCFPRLQSITFEPHSTLREIKWMAFSGCPSLESICLPASVAVLDGGAFAWSALRRIEIEAGNPHFRVRGDYLMDAHEKSVIRYFGRDVDLAIPGDVETLGQSSFHGCDWIRSIGTVLPSRLRVIGKDAFEECRLLESVHLPSSLEHLEQGCFSACRRLTMLSFPPDSSLISIGESALSWCSSLTSLCLPSNLRSVGDVCFYGSDSLSNLTFESPSHLKELGDLPAVWNVVREIPDCVETLAFPCWSPGSWGYVLEFGKESRLAKVVAERGFESSEGFVYLRVAARTLKLFRSRLEFAEDEMEAEDMEW